VSYLFNLLLLLVSCKLLDFCAKVLLSIFHDHSSWISYFYFYFEAHQFDMTMQFSCKISSKIYSSKSLNLYIVFIFYIPHFYELTLELLLWHLNSARPWLGCEECWLASNKISLSIRCFKYLFNEISCDSEIQYCEIISNDIFAI
jgi:hypothetical protein